MPSYRKLKSGKWQAGVWHPGLQKRLYRTDPLKKVVQEWAVRTELEIARGEFIDPDAGLMTLGEWWEVWLTTRSVAKATAAKNETHWRVHIEPTFGRARLSGITQLDVKQWVADKVAAQTGGEALATALRLLRQLLEDAVEAKRLRRNPAQGVRAPRPPKHVDRFLDIDEADRLVASITRAVRPPAGTPRSQRWTREPDPVSQLLVKLMLDAGLRWQEAAGLHHFRVDVRRRRVRVQEVVDADATIKAQPKSEAGSRWVPLTDELVGMYLEVVDLTGRREGLIFPGAVDGRGLDYDNWTKRVWAPAVAAAGLAAPLPTPHDCRHSYGSWLADQGVPPHEIMVLMGHGSLRAVERYIHASEARMERARQALVARGLHRPGEQQEGPASRVPGNGA